MRSAGTCRGEGGLTYPITALALSRSGALTFTHDQVIIDKCYKAVECETGDDQPSDEAEHMTSFQLFMMNGRRLMTRTKSILGR